MAIETSIENGVATVTIDYPERLNALDADSLELLARQFTTLAADDAVRVIILTGGGDRAFVAGADIRQMADLDPAGGVRFARLGHAAASAIEQAPQPVIAAINGFALGGGSELALACDIRLGSETVVFAQPEVSLGIPPGWGGTQRLPKVVGSGIASELIFTGRRVKAEEALRIGLVNAIYPAADLMAAAREMASQIARNSPHCVREAKALIATSFEGDHEAGLQAEEALFGAAFDHPDRQEGMTAFLDKRTPTFVDGTSA